MTIPPPQTGIVAALGLVQILTWGSTFYLLAILGDPIAQDTGWSRAGVTAGISLALLTSGLAAGAVGRAITARGGRVVMMAGVGLLVVGLLGLAVATSLPVYFAAWGVLGCAMAATLYEAAFSTLGRIFGGEARGAITRLTLIGGFSATICWPLSAVFLDTFGWRGTCLAYAALHLCVTLPLCRFGLPEARRAVPSAPPTQRDLGWRDARLQAMALAGTCLVFIFSTLAIHLIPLLVASGYSLATAVGFGTLIGPCQVAARLLEMLGRERHSPLITMVVATSCVAAGTLGLAAQMPAALCLMIYGLGLGLWTIARGTVPLALFGPEHYAATMARLALPVLAVSAMAPVVGALVMPALGPTRTLLVLGGVACIPLAVSLLLWRGRVRHTAG